MSFWQCELLNLRHRHCECKKRHYYSNVNFSVDICNRKTLEIVLLGLNHCCKSLNSRRTKEIISLFSIQMISLLPIILIYRKVQTKTKLKSQTDSQKLLH